MAPLRINKKCNIIAPIPTKPPHTIISSYAEDGDKNTGPFGMIALLEGCILPKRTATATRTINRITALVPQLRSVPFQSMGEVMLAQYGNEALASDVVDVGNGER
ncbi:hypothetical protein FRC01_006812 [Tulasnella sp. 417]|nr:hypothetical protein FRC01_006812 [Tulasnella sp. 417]